MALSTSVNWISNFIVAFITPPLFGSIQGGYYFLLLGFTCISGLFVYFVYPETAGKTLEELGEVFGDKPVDGGDMGDVEVAEMALKGSLEDRIEGIAIPDVYVEGAEGKQEVTCPREESDEDDMVDVDVNSVNEELEGRGELDADIQRWLLEVPSEVTLPVAQAEDEKGDQGPRLESKEKTLEDID